MKLTGIKVDVVKANDWMSGIYRTEEFLKRLRCSWRSLQFLEEKELILN
jgi:hypothetical protein